MPEDLKELAQIMQFQQSLMRLVTRGAEEQAKSQEEVTERARQLEVWVRKVRAKAD
jgi:hypothetical protein